MLTWMSLKRQDTSWGFPAFICVASPSGPTWKRLVVLCSLLLATCSSPTFVDTVLFLVTEDRAHGQVTIEPVLQIERGQFEAPPQDGTLVEQVQAQKQVLPLYRQGQLVGRAEIESQSSYACSPSQYQAQLEVSVDTSKLAYSADGIRYYLASSTLLFDTPVAVSALTDSERALVERTARAQLTALGVKEQLLAAARLTDAAHLAVGRQPVLVGTVTLLADSQSHAGAVAFVLLEKQPTGDWKLAYSNRRRFEDIYGRDFDGQVFREAIDLNRDGSAELVLERFGNEVYQFQVLQRREGQWQVIYSGGGGGC